MTHAERLHDTDAQGHQTREQLNAALKTQWQEWEIPHETDKSWPHTAKELHAEWWQARVADLDRQAQERAVEDHVTAVATMSSMAVVPRSGCLSTSPAGARAITIGTTR